MDKEDVVGRPTGAAKVTIERGPLAKFATSVHDNSPVYQDVTAARAAGFDDIPLPPTYAFSGLQYWGAFPDDQPEDPTGGKNPMLDIMYSLRSEGGGMILHGEQEFEYHRPVVAGETLTCEGKITDFYSKESSSGRVMTFIVTEDVYRDESGEPVLTSRMNLIHRA